MYLIEKARRMNTSDIMFDPSRFAQELNTYLPTQLQVIDDILHPHSPDKRRPFLQMELTFLSLTYAGEDSEQLGLEGLTHCP